MLEWTLFSLLNYYHETQKEKKGAQSKSFKDCREDITTLVAIITALERWLLGSYTTSHNPYKDFQLHWFSVQYVLLNVCPCITL